MNDPHHTHPAATQAFWSTRWHHNQIGFHKPTANERLVADFDPALGGATRGRILVPLCGKSHDLTWLAGHFREVVGVEFVEQAALDYARESGRSSTHGRFAPPGAAPHTSPCVSVGPVHIVIDDFFATSPASLGRFDAAYDRAALIALPPDLRPRYAAHLVSLLTPGAQTLIVTLDYPQSLRDGPPFAVGDDEVVALFSPHGVLTRLSHGPVDDGPSGIPANAVTTSTFRLTLHRQDHS